MATLSVILKLIGFTNSKLFASISNVKMDSTSDIHQLTNSISEKLNVLDQAVKQVQQRCTVLEATAMSVIRLNLCILIKV